MALCRSTGKLPEAELPQGFFRKTHRLNSATVPTYVNTRLPYPPKFTFERDRSQLYSII